MGTDCKSALSGLFEVLTLVQNRMIAGFPILIYDSEYHKDLYEHIQMMSKHESIGPENMEHLFMTDSVEELVAHIRKYAIKKFGLRKIKYKPK